MQSNGKHESFIFWVSTANHNNNAQLVGELARSTETNLIRLPNMKFIISRRE